MALPSMKWLGQAAKQFLAGGRASVTSEVKHDLIMYGFHSQGALSGFGVTTDAVLGGNSTAKFTWHQYQHFSTAQFEGVIDFDRDDEYTKGGFAAVRPHKGARAHVVDGQSNSLYFYDAMAIRLKGDGRLYKLNMYCSGHTDEDVYQLPLQPAPGVWQTLVLPFESFQLVSQGQVREDQYAIDRDAINGMGVLLADSQNGPFKLEVQWIKALAEHDASPAAAVAAAARADDAANDPQPALPSKSRLIQRMSALRPDVPAARISQQQEPAAAATAARKAAARVHPHDVKED